MAVSRAKARATAVLFCSVALLLTTLFPLNLDQASARDLTDPRDFFGVVGYDPWYAYNTDPENFPNAVNRDFLENMMAGMASMGARWVRIEVHAEYDEPVGPGRIDYSKMDWYINELAPKYGVKILLVLGAGTIGDFDKTYQLKNINNPTDAQGHNVLSRAFVERALQVINRYGDRVAAYEIMNEPNANQLLHWETEGREKAVNPEVYGRIATDIYQNAKASHPSVQFVIGSLLHDQQGSQALHLDWLSKVYGSRAFRSYVQQRGRNPLDGVSLHPYWQTPAEILVELNRLRGVQASFGDSSPVWITEIGLAGEPPLWSSYGIMDPTPTEREQAEFLQAVYTTLRDQAPFVDRVFWFKYEDFGEGTWLNWGLVRLRESSFRYGPEAIPWPRKDAYRVYQSLARPDQLPTAPVPSPSDLGPRVRHFPETGHTLRDPFLRYWEQHGGLARFGFPRTEVFFVQGRAVQYFERARFEYWPENKGTEWEIQLGLLGRYVTRDRTFARQPAPASPEPGRTYFPQTGQYLSFGFKEYWEKNGGLALYGYPISGELQETNPADGKTYTVQYFERARFEWHPEHQGTPHEVQLGLLGNQVLAAPGWLR